MLLGETWNISRRSNYWHKNRHAAVKEKVKLKPKIGLNIGVPNEYLYVSLYPKEGLFVGEENGTPKIKLKPKGGLLAGIKKLLPRLDLKRLAGMIAGVKNLPLRLADQKKAGITLGLSNIIPTPKIKPKSGMLFGMKSPGFHLTYPTATAGIIFNPSGIAYPVAGTAEIVCNPFGYMNLGTGTAEIVLSGSGAANFGAGTAEITLSASGTANPTPQLGSAEIVFEGTGIVPVPCPPPCTCLTFNGTSNYVQASDAALGVGTGIICVSCWCKPISAIPSASTAFMIGSAPSYCYMQAQVGGGQHYWACVMGGNGPSSANFPLGAWSHIFFGRDASGNVVSLI